MKSNMRQKLYDACAFASKLRQTKGKLRKSLILKHSNDKQRTVQYLNRLRSEAENLQKKCTKKNDIKYSRCKLKQEQNTMMNGVKQTVIDF